jgi:hypothetical protein
MSGARTIGLTTLSLATLACASLGAQDRPPAFGIQCGGFGRPAVEIVVADSSAARGGTIIIANGEKPEGWDNGRAVEVWRGERLMRCATSIGTTEVRASVTDGLRLSIGASRPVPVTVRSAGGRELARATFQPGSPDVELRWEAAR